jgi:hypothetical protein
MGGFGGVAERAIVAACLLLAANWAGAQANPGWVRAGETMPAVFVSDIHFEPFFDPGKVGNCGGPVSEWKGILAGPASVDREQRFAAVEQVCHTLSSWIKLHRVGALKGVVGKSVVTAEQMEIGRLRAELARLTMERDILGNRRHCLQRARSDICLYLIPQVDLADPGAMPRPKGKRIWISPTFGSSE